MISVAELAFHQRLGRLLAQLNEPGFWPALTGFLRHVVTFDSWVALIFRAGQPPRVLHEGNDDQVEDALFAEYVASFYALDPYYLFSATPFTPGIYRLDDVAPEHFRHTEYFKRYFVHNVVEDEAQFLLPLPPHGVFSLSLGSRTRFTDAEIGGLCLLTPWLMPLMKLAATFQIQPAEMLPPVALSLETRLRRRGSPALTDREVQVAMLLLAGHPTKGIAGRLKISPETVKVHRRNFYDKLGVSSQAEIFALFIN
jgi:DNA-binding CsgD family transcriptional regulator